MIASARGRLSCGGEHRGSAGRDACGDVAENAGEGLAQLSAIARKEGGLGRTVCVGCAAGCSNGVEGAAGLNGTVRGIVDAIVVRELGAGNGAFACWSYL